MVRIKSSKLDLRLDKSRKSAFGIMIYGPTKIHHAHPVEFGTVLSAVNN